jgi:uncharacterized OsmC-like protein
MSVTTEPTPLPELIADLRENPERARITLRATGELLEGVRCAVEARDHRLELDEPPFLGGTDAGPNPVEAVLAALGACQAITYRVWAALLGLRLDGVRFETEGDIDLRGFLGLADGVRPGLGRIRHRIVLVGPETEERYRHLERMVNAHCPVLDIVTDGLPVERSVEVEAA